MVESEYDGVEFGEFMGQVHGEFQRHYRGFDGESQVVGRGMHGVGYDGRVHGRIAQVQDFDIVPILFYVLTFLEEHDGFFGQTNLDDSQENHDRDAGHNDADECFSDCAWLVLLGFHRWCISLGCFSFL